jgi:hypothetical protein
MTKVLISVFAVVLVAISFGADAFGTESTIRMRVAPSSVTAGQRVFVTAGVRPSGVLCKGALRHGGTSIPLRPKRAVGGAVSWTTRIPASGPGGVWTASLACAKAGTATARFSVVIPPPPPPPTIPAKVIVVKSGVSSRYSYIGSTFVGYGVVLQNVSPDEDALEVAVTVNVLDAGGSILHSDSNTYVGIPASSTYYAGGESIYSGSTAAAKLEVTVQVGSGQAKRIGELPPVANIRWTEDFLGIDVLGEFTNPYSQTLASFARITAVCFDSAGNVIGGGRTYPSSSVAPGGRIGFDVSIEGALHASQIASAQVSVEPKVE